MAKISNATLVTVVTPKIKYKMIHPPEGQPRNNFKWEPLLTERIENFIDKNSPIVFYDVGSAFGIFSKLVSLLDKKNKVYAFEPYTPRWLTNFINTMFCFNIRLYKTYVGSEVKNGFTTLAHFSKRTGTIPDLIKMDIEGAEYEALLGSEEWLQEHMPTLFLEFHENIMKNTNRDPQMLLDLFDRLGYKVNRIEHHEVDQGNYVLEILP
jgi:hypothetical protein